jgi:ribose 5-phosphate isomerase B
MKIGICSDHGGYALKEIIRDSLKEMDFEVEDFGAYILNGEDDYPDYVIPLAQAIAANTVSRGIAICGSGIGASIAANKVAGVRAALITEHFSAHQGVEDDDMNMICFGGWITGTASARELVSAFLNATFTGEERHRRRLKKVSELEK